MIHLRLRTEFSFRRAFGTVAKVIERASAPGDAVAITDAGTWGHVNFAKTALKMGRRPILGAEVAVVADATAREKQPTSWFALLARNGEGLRELYATMTRANTEQFYYTGRLSYADINALSENLYVITGSGASLAFLRPRPHVYIGLDPSNPAWNRTVAAKAPRAFGRVVVADNAYPTPEDRVAYEVLAAQDRRVRTSLLHIPTEDELRVAIPEADDDAFMNTERIAADCTTTLPHAEMVRYPHTETLEQWCRRGAVERRINLTVEPYASRLVRELQMIESKGFTDYFAVIGDMVRVAKTKMLVGPARGSSAGSLVCFLMGITDVDPIVHDLMFERFIDVTREDLPDVDIDFPDDRRDLVMADLAQRYGPERVGRLGTVARYKPKSCLGDVAKALGIPPWEMTDLKGAIVERSSGDARAAMCILDTFEQLDIGRAMMAKYPALRIAAELEGHATHSGTHAAGIIVAEHPITHYASISKDGTAQLDKKDAEALNMLKIDALGLRTLSVIQDCLDQIGKTRDWLVTLPLDDREAFEIFNADRFSGIFQFEGYALQTLTRQMKIQEFNDIVAITALARPGPLHCGAANTFVARRIGAEATRHMHPLVEPITRDTYGTVIYQEQVMAIGREVGRLSWEHVSELRKAMSKSLGDEFFNRYWEMFKVGATAQGIPEREARAMWDSICTFGSWAFNKSHAVSYGLVSYWCAVLKAHWPLEFAAASLRNAKDNDQSIKILRDLVTEGFQYRPVDPQRSGLEWAVVDGILVGGLTNIRGLGPAKAKEIMARRARHEPLLPGMVKLLTNAVTPYDDIFEGRRRFGAIYDNPRAHRVESGPVSFIRDVNEAGEYVVIGKLVEKKLRDVNEQHSLAKRGGRAIKAQTEFLNLVIEDDTGQIIAQISRYDFRALGKPIIEGGKIGDWYMFKGTIRGDWRLLTIKKVRRLQDDERYPK